MCKHQWQITAFFRRTVVACASSVSRVAGGQHAEWHIRRHFNAHHNEDEFLGIPYAQVPNASSRFKEPLNLDTSWGGTRNPNVYSPICGGHGSDSNYNRSSEDCPTLNIVWPAGVPSEPLPIMVWLYGGGFYQGGTIDPRYNMARIVQQSIEASKPFIGVSLNYRLSAFRFLWSEEVEANGSVNNGPRDQTLALHWIQENIQAFGGEPGKVTLFGESAGGIAIGRHLTAYNGRNDNLFRVVIMQSGGPLERWLSFEKLNSALNITNAWIPGIGLGPWLSVIDGDFLLDYQNDQVAGRIIVKVPILRGTNADEATAIGPPGVDTDVQFRAAVAQGGPNKETISVIESLYPEIGAIGIPAGHVLTAPEQTTYDMVENFARRTAVLAYAREDLTAYSYRFNVLLAGLPAAIGVTHYQEVAWMSNKIDGLGYSTNPFNGSHVHRDAYIQVSTLMSRMWASFAADLNPNNHGLTGCPRWPAYSLEEGGVGDNFAFDADVTPYVERDNWRVPGMAFIASKTKSQWKF